MSTEASLKHLKPAKAAMCCNDFPWKRINLKHVLGRVRTGERSDLRTSRLQRWQFTWRFLSVHPEKE